LAPHEIACSGACLEKRRSTGLGNWDMQQARL
jgi:hypothetical protein